MAELTISADEIRAALDDYVASYSPDVSREEVGTVAETGDGIARVEGLPSAMTNELLRFEDGTLGLAQTLDVREIGVVILGEQQGIDEGQTVRRTGEILSVPVGDGFLGRVIDPLGQPIDGLGEIREEGPPAAGAAGAERGAAAAGEGPLQTGIKAIDAMTAIGRGQRQLIIGDRQTGKTTIAIDTILNQKANWADRRPEAASPAASTSRSGRRAPRSPRCARRSRSTARSTTRRSSPPPPRTPPASNTWRRTPARPSASTGCTAASTC
jgi:F-type H+-transporting ATPase subunit alpha